VKSPIDDTFAGADVGLPICFFSLGTTALMRT